jgi:ectoine hydroxylase-related dioxygenase (phytanoyl-CoA dioxygenase family)
MIGAMPSLAKLLSLSKKPSAVLARDGAAVVRSFLDRDEASALKATVEDVFSALAACTGFANGDMAYHYQSRQAIWLRELPAFLEANNRALLPRYQACIDRVTDRTRALFGAGWQPYLSRSFIRRMTPQLRLPWHLDADAAKLDHPHCCNVWLPLERVGTSRPSLEIILGSHRKLRASVKQKDAPALLASLGKPWTPRLDPGDVLVFDQFTYHRSQIIDGGDGIRTSCEFRFYDDGSGKRTP